MVRVENAILLRTLFASYQRVSGACLSLSRAQSFLFSSPTPQLSEISLIITSLRTQMAPLRVDHDQLCECCEGSKAFPFFELPAGTGSMKYDYVTRLTHYRASESDLWRHRGRCTRRPVRATQSPRSSSSIFSQIHPRSHAVLLQYYTDEPATET
jgi:hypothetical protein